MLMYLCLAIAALWLSRPIQSLETQSKNDKKARTAETLNKEKQKLSLDRLLTLLQAMKKGDIPPKSLQNRIRDLGLDFSLTPEIIQRLSDAGGTSEMIAFMAPFAKPLPAPPPPPPPGQLNVECHPGECEVVVSGASKGVTKQEKLSIPNLDAGNLVVSVSKAGYLTQESDVTIARGKTSNLAFDLEPTRATKELFGDQLYRKALQALGSEAGLRRALNAETEGDAKFVSLDGTDIRFQLRCRFAVPDRIRFDLLGAGLDHRVAWIAGERESNEGLKDQPSLAITVESDLQDLRDSLLPALMLRFGSPNTKRLAKSITPPVKGELQLVVESGTDTFTVALDSAKLFPTQIEQASGAGSTLTSVYRDYDPQSPAFPKSVALRHTGAKSSGMEVRFSQVNFDRRFKDSDFRIKKPFGRK